MISKSDRSQFFNASSLARFGEHRVRVGAVAVTKGKRLAGAFNTFRNLPSVEYPYCTTHAEMNLLSMIPYEKRSKVTIYVARVNLQNKIMPSAPCATCRRHLILAGIKYVVYYDGREIRKEKPADAKS